MTTTERIAELERRRLLLFNQGMALVWKHAHSDGSEEDYKQGCALCQESEQLRAQVESLKHAN